MACADKIAKDILNSCDEIPRAGYEAVAWAINREDIDTITYDATVPNLVEAITLDSGTKGYIITAVKKEANAGFDLVTGDDIPDNFTHYFSFKPYEQDSAAIKNFDDMEDLVIIAELKGDKTEGCFVIFGLEKGLFKSSGTQRGNDNYGLPQYEFSTLEGQGERYSRFVFWDTDYATTKAAIEALTPTYGPELHDDSNAAADPNGTEANGTVGWTPNGLTGTGSNVFQSQSGDVNEGTYALEADANDTPTAGCYFQNLFTLEAGETYRLTFDAKHKGTGGDWAVWHDAVNLLGDILSTATSWASYEFIFVAPDINSSIRFGENNASNDGAIYVDNLSLKKVL